jgi:hypothetical protein
MYRMQEGPPKFPLGAAAAPPKEQRTAAPARGRRAVAKAWVSAFQPRMAAKGRYRSLWRERLEHGWDGEVEKWLSRLR